jgi:TonB-linked SusC/RagA family outer membrane protein
MFICLIGLQVVLAQTKAIRGRILDASGEPIPGASIRIKGTNRGTNTDANGNFKLNVNEGEKLTISAIGMKATEQAADDGMSVKLATNTKGLGEVVVTALGIRRAKEDLGYATTKVLGSDVTNTRQANVFNSLSGKVAGLDIKQNNMMGGSTNIVIRGFKSLGGSNQALIVVDGIPFDNSNTNTADQQSSRGGYDYGNAAADINPDDISSINVLKGPAATALYGARGANGVILIETKKGKKGLNITFSTGASTGRLDKSTFVNYQNKYGAGYSPSFRTAFDVNGDGVKDTMARTNHDASFGPAFDENKLVYDWTSIDPNSPNYLKKRPWVAAANGPSTFFENPMSLSNSLILSTANDKSNLKIAYTRNDDKGYMPNSKITKDLFSISLGHSISDRLTATIAANTSFVKGKGRFGTGYQGNNLMTNFRQWWQTNVDINELKDAYFRNEEINTTWNWNNYNNLTPAYWDNPYWVRNKNFQTDSRARFFGNTSLTYVVTDWLNILGRVSIDSYNELQEERVATGSQMVDQQPRYRRFDRTFKELNYDLMANINKNLNDDLKLTGVVGINYNSRRINQITSETNGGLNIPNVYTLSNTKLPMLPSIESAPSRDIRGVFASLNLGYKEFLYLDITGRNDVSSTLPSGKNSYFYPSASLAYIFTKHIANMPTWLNYGKLRASFAGVGADAPFASTDDYYIANTSFGSTPLFNPQTTKSNKDLKPERTVSKEIGLELATKNNRITLDMSIYQSNSLNQILAVPVSNTTGFSRKFINAGSIQNNGIEIALGVKPIQTKDFTWGINVNWTRNRNKVIALAEGVDNIQLGSFQSGVTLNAAVGRPFGELRGSDFVYLDGKKVIDSTTGLYKATTSFNETIGNINPDWNAGITNSFKYKNVGLSFLIDIRQGGSVYSLDQYYGLTTGLYDYSVEAEGNATIRENGKVFEGVTEDGKVNTVKASYDAFMTFPNKYAVYDASFVKLREVTFTYSLPKRIFNNNKFIKGIDLSLYGRNLAILHKNLPYADPEDSQSSGNLQGFQSGSYPLFRMYGINGKFNF